MPVKKVPALFWVCLLFSGLLLIPAVSLADDYSFNLDEFEKKSFTLGGFAVLKWNHININQTGAFGLLAFYNESRSEVDRLTSIVQLDGNLNKGAVDFNWLLQASAQKDQFESATDLDIFSTYVSIKPTPSVIFDLGKKTFKWGKGYAWNPVGFIERPKDPNNPEDALEGYIGAGVDLIKSYPGTLQTVALTGVILPVREGINEDFGELNHINFAAKFYLLYRDTDIDFILFTGGSRSTRYGIDFSKNLASNFEIHGEIAHTPELSINILSASGIMEQHEIADTSYLLGLRYLTTNDITTIIEFYHNGSGYSETEMSRFYQLVNDSNAQYIATGDDSLLRQASVVSRSGYANPQAGRDYLYGKITQKEPFDLLYFTLGVTTIINLNDESYTLSPEVIYTRVTNLELLLRYSYIHGGRFTENGEKLSENKLELRLRYYF